MMLCRDTGYTYIYFAGADNDRSQSYILTIVGNYVRSRRDVLFWLDRNNDLDFTNDGPPDTLTYMEHDMVIKMANVEDSNAVYAIKLSRFKYNENVQYKRMLDEHYRTHSGNKTFTKVNYSYREQRYNSRMARFKSETDSFAIGLKDMDVNGMYADAGTDQFYIGSYHSDMQSDLLIELEEGVNSFEWNGKRYDMVHIDPAGTYLELRIDSTARIKNQLKLGRSTPDFEYVNILNDKHMLSEFKHTEVYLYFWQIDLMSEEDVLYLNKLSKEFEGQLEVVALNHGDKPRNVRIEYYYAKYAFPVAYSTSDIGELYQLQDIPRGYYLGKRCKLKNDKISPKALYELLSSEQDQ